MTDGDEINARIKRVADSNNPKAYYTKEERRGINQAWDMLLFKANGAKGINRGKTRLCHGLGLEKVERKSQTAAKAILLAAWLRGWEAPHCPLWTVACNTEGVLIATMIGAAMAKYGHDDLILRTAVQYAVSLHHQRQARYIEATL